MPARSSFSFVQYSARALSRSAGPRSASSRTNSRACVRACNTALSWTFPDPESLACAADRDRAFRRDPDLVVISLPADVEMLAPEVPTRVRPADQRTVSC